MRIVSEAWSGEAGINVLYTSSKLILMAFFKCGILNTPGVYYPYGQIVGVYIIYEWFSTTLNGQCSRVQA